jgi:hypothetical protein
LKLQPGVKSKIRQAGPCLVLLFLCPTGREGKRQESRGKRVISSLSLVKRAAGEVFWLYALLILTAYGIDKTRGKTWETFLKK